jgi:hypothetical protein
VVLQKIVLNGCTYIVSWREEVPGKILRKNLDIGEQEHATHECAISAIAYRFI